MTEKTSIKELDASKYTYGRLVSEAARILHGKHTAQFTPNKVFKQPVQIKNLKRVSFTGKKLEQKIIYRHTLYPGQLRKDSFQQLFMKNPEKVFLNSLRRMLPKNRLQKEYMKMLTFIS